MAQSGVTQLVVGLCAVAAALVAWHQHEYVVHFARWILQSQARTLLLIVFGLGFIALTLDLGIIAHWGLRCLEEMLELGAAMGLTFIPLTLFQPECADCRMRRPERART
jgi:hypothetical protein